MKIIRQLMLIMMTIPCSASAIPLWASTKETFLTTASSVCEAAKKTFLTEKTSARSYFLDATGVCITGIGVWSLINGIKTINGARYSLGAQFKDEERGKTTTTIGLVCIMLGVALVVTSKPLANYF